MNRTGNQSPLASNEALPLNRSLVHGEVGQLVAIFQIDRNKPAGEVDARSLARDDDGVAVVAVANGGTLTETAFNLWTLGSQLFLQAGCPATNRVDFSLSAMARLLWGENGRSAERRRRVVAALQNLITTQVETVGFDPYRHERNADAVFTMNLLEAAGARADIRDMVELARTGDDSQRRSALARLASARWDSRRRDEETWSLVLPGWLAQAIRQRRGVFLDYDVQRRLRGSAKSIWVQLQTHPHWVDHVLFEPESEDLEQVASAITVPTLEPVVMPTEDEPQITLQSLVIPLDNEAYRALGITHANRKRDLEAALRGIVRNDRTYLRAEVVGLKRRRYELHVVRATGSLRERRLEWEARRRRREEARKVAARTAVSGGPQALPHPR